MLAGAQWKKILFSRMCPKDRPLLFPAKLDAISQSGRVVDVVHIPNLGQRCLTLGKSERGPGSGKQKRGLRRMRPKLNKHTEDPAESVALP